MAMDAEGQKDLERAVGWNLTDSWLQDLELNLTDHNTHINFYYYYETEQITVLWILFVFIVVGNSAVLVALSMGKSRKSRMRFFSTHLAIADLSVGLISVGTDLIWRITVSWNAGNVACKMIKFLQCVVTYSSTYVLVALSIDRYDAITHPMNFSGSWRRARMLVATAWTLSAIFSLPIIVLYEEKEIQGRMQCWIKLEPWQWKLYMSVVSILLFLAPALIISFCYLVIVLTIWSKSKLLMPPRRYLNGEQVPDFEMDCRRASSRGIIPRAKIKTVKMTFGIVFVFIVCWCPYILFDLLQAYGFITETQSNIAVATFMQSLAPLNSAANPIIYCVFSTAICRSLRRVPPISWILCCIGLDEPPRPVTAEGASRRGRFFRYLYNPTDSSSVTDTLTNPASSMASLKQRQQTVNVANSAV
ncbi:cardioacceleratory peptide receptor-like [Thrips palmi]|uniref:Cardioacceleratory peptide receptor-like n=1 Tax=Thrips palmi TaxID=161013 RepID=A0A6P8YLR4_THRPL|nr:cardioacceleratory peptide receptor-like [Thrips palmi]XP_034238055.1 cardioacceleratory peptide receptor-like [Thrips palmi]XP_034238056.1 cardioacceleratory peptide receptor-like [Thrips palmi]